MNKETVLCPVKGVNIYLWVCKEKCSYKKKKKCPLDVKAKTGGLKPINTAAGKL